MADNSRYKFRAWDIECKEMCPITDLDLSGDEEYGYFEGSRPSGGAAVLKPDECILMQCTGLLDKNGKEIYEGDIVAHKNGWTGAIVWNQEDCAFISESILDKTDTAWLAQAIQEIIGNIYENPDLIEI